MEQTTSVVKTTSNGNWLEWNPQALTLGQNNITVSACEILIIGQVNNSLAVELSTSCDSLELMEIRLT